MTRLRSLMRVQSSPLILFCVGCWVAHANDQNQWIQADLQTTHRIERVITQGQSAAYPHTWVKSYKFSYRRDGTNWVELPDLYVGNSNGNGKKTNILPDYTEARFIRLQPIEWERYISMRFDVTGCEVDYGKLPLVT